MVLKGGDKSAVDEIEYSGRGGGKGSGNIGKIGLIPPPW
jgi:hypothetical protein